MAELGAIDVLVCGISHPCTAFDKWSLIPVLDDDALSKIVKINREGDLPGYQTYVARGLYEVDGGTAFGLQPAR